MGTQSRRCQNSELWRRNCEPCKYRTRRYRPSDPTLSVFQALTSLDLKNSRLTDFPPCHLLPLISGSGMELEGNPFESFDTTDRNFSCINFNEGFSRNQFTTIPNLCKTSNLPANVEWAAFPEYTMIDCDCSALWLKVKTVNNFRHLPYTCVLSLCGYRITFHI